MLDPAPPLEAPDDDALDPAPLLEAPDDDEAPAAELPLDPPPLPPELELEPAPDEDEPAISEPALPAFPLELAQPEPATNDAATRTVLTETSCDLNGSSTRGARCMAGSVTVHAPGMQCIKEGRLTAFGRVRRI